MTDDIVLKLKKSIDAHAPVSVEDLRAAVTEINHLRLAERTLTALRSDWRSWAVCRSMERRRSTSCVNRLSLSVRASRSVQSVTASGGTPMRSADAPTTIKVNLDSPAADMVLKSVEERISRLERSVRDNTRRLDLAYRACLMNGLRGDLHLSVAMRDALESNSEGESDA